MNLLASWHVPTDFKLLPEEIAILEEGPSPSLRCARLSVSRLRELLALLRSAHGRILVDLPVHRVVRAVDRVALRLLDPGDRLRREALEALGPHAGISEAMARLVLDGMAKDWTAERQERLLAAEFADPLVLDRFRAREGGGRVRALGYPLAFHLGAGTVPGVATTSLIRSLLVKSAVLVKPGRGDVVLPVVFARGLEEVDPDLAKGVAVAYWPGKEEEPLATVLGEADLAVVYGSDDTARWVRDRLPITTPLRAYRHRLGVGLVGRDALGAGATEVALAAARAVAHFDQRGCVSPHAFLVEEGGMVSPAEWGRLLAEAMAEIERALPSGTLTPEEGAALQQFRGTAELEEAAGRGAAVYHGGGGASWTVFVHPGAGIRPSCLGRTVTLLPVEDLVQAPALLATWTEHLQTVGVVGLGDREDSLVELLARAGVARVAPLEEVPWPPPWWHHDGSGPLGNLVRWTDWED